MTRRRLVLASASSARLDLLRRAGLDPTVLVSGVDEEGVEAPDASALTLLLARRKAEAVADLPAAADALVLGCDSMLELDGGPYGKPHTAAVATARWHLMRGREALLHTGHHVIDTTSGVAAGAVESTTVRFASPTDAEIAAYVGSGEPLEVAGAFTLDGRGAAFVAGIDGNPSNVIGLSIPLLRTLMAGLGLSIVDLWA